MKILVFLLSLCVTSLEAATITNWGAQLPTMVPASGDVILMQKGGVTYYFTPNQLATQLSTNANLVIAGSDSNALYSIILANGTSVSNGVVTMLIANDTTTSNGLYTVETTRNGAVSNSVVTLLVANDTTTSNGLYVVETTRNAAVSNAVVALIGSAGGISTNANQFGPSTNLSIKSGALLTNAIVYDALTVIGTGTNQLGYTAFTNLSAGVLALDANLTAYTKTDLLTNLQSTGVSLQGGLTSAVPIVVTQALAGGSVIVGRYVGNPSSYENGLSNVYSGTALSHYSDFWVRQNGTLHVPLRLRGDGISEISSNLSVGMRLVGTLPRGTLELRAPISQSIVFSPLNSTSFTNRIEATGNGFDPSSNVVTITVTDQTGIAVGSTFKQRGNGITELSGVLQVNGTTNQIQFGATNVGPAVATVVKWVSVRVAGETNAYRLPLYEQ